MVKDKKVCKRCGYCEECGRGPANYYPVPYPYYPQPTWGIYNPWVSTTTYSSNANQISVAPSPMYTVK